MSVGRSPASGCRSPVRGVTSGRRRAEHQHTATNTPENPSSKNQTLLLSGINSARHLQRSSSSASVEHPVCVEIHSIRVYSLTCQIDFTAADSGDAASRHIGLVQG